MRLLHVLHTVSQMPHLVHYTKEDGDLYQCVTVRGQGRCFCGTYRLCDPQAIRCAEDCQCLCHSPSEE
jgi:hypothetical protein